MTILGLDLGVFAEQYLIPWGSRLAIVLVLLIVGLWLVRRVRGLADRIMVQAKVDELLRGFLRGIVYWLGTVIVLMVVLDQLGVETTSALAVLGAAGLAVALALKDSMANVASGVMLILFRPFATGDFVDAAGVSGTVREVNLFSTRMRTGDNREVIIPNSKIYGSAIINFSTNHTRRIDLVFGIGYRDDIDQARRVIAEVLARQDAILSKPEVVVAVLELADSSVNIAVRPWVRTEDYWTVRFALIEDMKKSFDAVGISIPFPQRDVHIQNDAA